MSQCLFVENAPTKLLAINPPSATSSSNAATPKSSSSNKKTIRITMGVLIPVIFIAGILIFCIFLRRKKRSKKERPKSVHSVHVQPIPSSPPVDLKELDAEKTAIHELSGSQRHGQLGQESSLAHVPPGGPGTGDRFQGVEYIANQGVGLLPSEPLLDSVHEVHGSQTTPYELAADIRSEMPGAPVTRKASSGGASSLNRHSRSFFGFSSRRSSTQGSIPTPGSPASAGGGQTILTTSKRQSMTTPPPQEFSPISPIAEGETAGPAGLNTVLIRDFSQSSRSSKRTPKVTQERPDGDTGAI